jgi:hypothetical protein
MSENTNTNANPSVEEQSLDPTIDDFISVPADEFIDELTDKNNSSTTDAKKKKKKKSEDEDGDVSEIGLPESHLGWYALSTSNNLTMEFIREHHKKLYLDVVMRNEKLPFREEVADEFEDEIDWTRFASSVAYVAVGIPTPTFTDEYDTTLLILRDHAEQVDWAKVSHPTYFTYPNPIFFEEFRNEVNWNTLITESTTELDKEMIELASKRGLIDWDTVSKLDSYPPHFIENHNQHFNWRIFLSSHDERMITAPLLMQCRDNILRAAKADPDIMGLVADKGKLAFVVEDNLNRYVWIDRAGGLDRFFADDSGTWVDTERDSDDDASSLESDYNEVPQQDGGEVIEPADEEEQADEEGQDEEEWDEEDEQDYDDYDDMEYEDSFDDDMEL